LLLDPDVARWLRPPPLTPFTEAIVAERLDADVRHWAEHGYGLWVLFDRKGERFLGRAGIKWTEVAGEHAVELAWALLPSSQGAGLATEAARAAVAMARSAGLRELVAFALTGNEPSRRVMEKLGMSFAGEIEHVGLPHVLFRLALG
jgi:RimJ/RimL family protein N-acetyltransferase